MIRSRWLYTGPVIAILIGHYVVDTYSSVIPPLIGVVQQDFNMQPAGAALLLGIGAIFSGLSQPLFAWISDLTGTRIYGALGILLAALGIGLVGFSFNASILFAVYAIGMIGVGMFHPIATARIGAIAGNDRSFAISLFFVFGMAGFFTGALLGPVLTTGDGNLRNLAWLIVPGIAMAIFLQANINRPGSHSNPDRGQPAIPFRDYDWFSIGLLYASAVFRFFVNMAIIYLIVRWVEQHVAEWNPQWSLDRVADYSAPIAGVANAWMFVGQGLGGLLAGAVIPGGKEKLALIWTPILFAPFIMLIAFVPPGAMGYIACFFGGVGFAAMTPITISVGQRLMPGHTRLASGLLLGGAWTIAALGPGTAELLIQRYDLTTSIVVTGIVLIFAGLSVIGLNDRSVRRGLGSDINGDVTV